MSEPHVVQFPPIGGLTSPTERPNRASCRAIPPIDGTPSLVLAGVVPTVQTTLANTSEHGLLSARWSALWAQQCLSWRTTRTRTPEHAREPLDTHVNPSTSTWAGLPTHISSGSRAGCQAHVQVIGLTCESKGPRAYGWADARSRRAGGAIRFMSASQERGTHDQLKSDFPARKSRKITLPATRNIL